MGEGRMHEPVKPVALIIMDGWGIREMTEANAVAQGNTPNYDTWERTRERMKALEEIFDSTRIFRKFV